MFNEYNMQRAASVNRLANTNNALSRSPSVRTIYVNEQTSKRSVNTIFHSPFKDGRPNKDYANPSFVSNHLFYPKEMLGKEEVVVRKNYIPHQSELRKEQLYRKRMNTEMGQRKAIKQRADKLNKGRAVNEGSRNEARGLRLMDNEQKLKRQLSLLQNYRHLQASQVKQKQQDALPPYFQRQRRDYNHQLQQHQKRQRTMRQFMETNRQQSNIRREEARRQTEKQNQDVQRNIEVHTKRLRQRQTVARNTSSLLGNILKEQIMTRQQSKGLI